MPRARSVIWAPRAKQDLAEIWRYYAQVASTEIADRILREIASAATVMELRVLPGRSRDELRPGLRSLIVHPHTIFFRISGGEAQVARVLHERRDFSAVFGDERE